MNASEYFLDHSLDADFVKKTFGVAWDKDKITFPVYDEKGKLLFCKYRHLNFAELKAAHDPRAKKFSADAGSHPALYCLHRIKKEPVVVLSEGEPDALRLWQEGIPTVTPTAGVKTFSAKLAEPLKGKTVNIVLDTDKAGTSEIEKYCQILAEVGASPFIIDLPPEYKDVCEYFTAGNTKEDFGKTVPLGLDDWLDAHTPEAYSFEEASELIVRPIPPEEWLVDRILPTEGFAFIIGAEATAKSFYALTLANTVATATPWLVARDKDGRPMFTVATPQKVLIIDKENTKRRIQSRMRGLSMTGQGIFYFRYPHRFQLITDDKEPGYSEIAKTAARKVKKENIKLVIIDSFTDVMVGNENAAGDVQAFFDAMRELFPGCCILVLHHASKPAQGFTRTSAQRTRGSTNIMAQTYSAFYVEPLPKSKTEFVLEQTKAGDAEKLNKFIVGLKVEPIPGQEGKTKVSALEYKGEAPDQEMKVAEAVEAIEIILNTKWQIPRQELFDALLTKGISLATAKRAVKEMTENGVIDSVPDPDNRVKRIIILAEGNRENENGQPF